jgi:hypothetical protein
MDEDDVAEPPLFTVSRSVSKKRCYRVLPLLASLS